MISRLAQVRGILADEIVVSTILDPFLSLKALAAYGGLSVRKLRDYLDHATHPLPYFRVGGKILVRRSEFDPWMSAFRNSTPELDAVVRTTLAGLRQDPPLTSSLVACTE